jgi:hypothetical protein
MLATSESAKPANTGTAGAEYNSMADIDISITTRDITVFKTRALELCGKIIENCKHRGAVYVKEVKTIASFKFQLYGPGLPRPVEIFRIPYDPIKMVKKFHVNAVKMYYNGTVYILRSCLSTLLSGVGETYKWFSCNKIPADVLLKYAQRGISIILNTHERETISNYIDTNERWKKAIKYLKINSSNIYCCVKYNHGFFYPGEYDCGIRMGLRRTATSVETNKTRLNMNSGQKFAYDFGSVDTHDKNKIFAPNSALISAALK